MVDTRRAALKKEENVEKVGVKKEGGRVSKKKKENPKEIISNPKRKEREESSSRPEVEEKKTLNDVVESEGKEKKSSSPSAKKAKTVKFAEKGVEDVETETTVPIDPPPLTVGENLIMDPTIVENVDPEKKEEKKSKKRDVSISYKRKRWSNKDGVTKKKDGMSKKKEGVAKKNMTNLELYHHLRFPVMRTLQMIMW